ncbi:hypothetical protein RsTz2092_05040 [Deferribacterales bacterium RsTz2092]|nr:hypothetical protein AGMMS49941_03870 [Deferribacterales bacterium]
MTEITLSIAAIGEREVAESVCAELMQLEGIDNVHITDNAKFINIAYDESVLSSALIASKLDEMGYGTNL